MRILTVTSDSMVCSQFVSLPRSNWMVKVYSWTSLAFFRFISFSFFSSLRRNCSKLLTGDNKVLWEFFFGKQPQFGVVKLTAIRNVAINNHEKKNFLQKKRNLKDGIKTFPEFVISETSRKLNSDELSHSSCWCFSLPEQKIKHSLILTWTKLKMLRGRGLALERNGTVRENIKKGKKRKF